MKKTYFLRMKEKGISVEFKKQDRQTRQIVTMFGQKKCRQTETETAAGSGFALAISFFSENQGLKP